MFRHQPLHIFSSFSSKSHQPALVMSSALASSSHSVYSTWPPAKRARPSSSKTSLDSSVDGDDSDDEVDPKDMSEEARAKVARKAARVGPGSPHGPVSLLMGCLYCLDHPEPTIGSALSESTESSFGLPRDPCSRTRAGEVVGENVAIEFGSACVRRSRSRQ